MSGTSAVVDMLRAQGFRVSAGYVQYALRERLIAQPERGAGGCLLWGDGDVARLKSLLYRRARGPKGGAL